MAASGALGMVTDPPNNGPQFHTSSTPLLVACLLFTTVPPLVCLFWVAATPNDDRATNYLFPLFCLKGF